MNKNTCTLIDYMGSDKSHSLAAWASTFAEFDVDLPENIENRVDVLVNHILNNGKKKRSIPELLEYLAANEHTSPFRFSSFIFACTTDIVTHYQKLKHSVILEAENGESARYKELMEDKFYLPEDWKETFVTQSIFMDGECIATIGENWYNVLQNFSTAANELYHQALKDLTPILGRKRAKESTRYFKTHNSQINTFNKLSFDGVMQFYHKRADSNVAQVEIAELANRMVNCIKNIEGNPFKYSLQAFGL